uniref:RING-type domain-containing protein n=1 Tax=Taeniopygia guttata TaxID=59729 RepID=A0A674HG85_TAEGU
VAAKPSSAASSSKSTSAAPGAVRVCHICVDFLRSPAAAVEPCGHVFCHACIQPQAGPDAAATCPICQGPIGAIRLLPGLDNRAGLAPRRPRRLHPFVLRWRQRQQREAQEDAAPGEKKTHKIRNENLPKHFSSLHPTPPNHSETHLDP